MEHQAVLAKLNLTNRNVVVDANGESVLVMNFEEAFPHHVDYVWCRAQGILSALAGFKPLFRKYVRGYEPRAVFPDSEVQFSIALCIKELQDEGSASNDSDPTRKKVVSDEAFEHAALS